MNLENLELKTYKNYKELCNALEWEVSSGNTKKKQLRILSEICNYEKQGNKFIIKEIYENTEVHLDMRGKQDNNTAPYVENIKLNIVGELLTKGINGKYVVGKGVLLRNIGLTNTNYSYCKRRQNKLATYLEINKEIVNEYYNNVDSMLLGNLEKALKDLSNQKVIQYNTTLLLCKNIITNITYEHITRVDEFDEEIETIKPIVQSDVIYVEATDEERTIILDVENNILKEMNEKRLTDVILKGKSKEYYSRCYKEIRKSIRDINFYFQAYNIIYLFDKLADYLEKNGYDDWSKELTKTQSELINSGAIKRIIDNATKRQEKSKKENDKGFGTKRDEKIRMRIKENYIPTYNKLNNSVINLHTENIKEQVHKVKQKLDV